METPTHLPSRPREFIDLSSDDEEEEDSVQELPELDPGHFPEFNDFDDLILGNLVRENQAAWDAAAFEAQGFQVPILGDWQNEAPEPVPEAINPPGGVAPGLPQMLRQAERLHLNHLPVNLLNEQQDYEQFHNDNDLIQGQVNNQLNNEQPDNEIDLILSNLNRQFPNARMEDDDNFVWEQVNPDLHNENNTIDLDPPPTEEMANKARCLQDVADIFPDICLEYVEQLYVALQGRKTSLAIIELILEGEENGQPYPKINQLKRKRPVESDDDEEIMQKYTADRQHNSDKYLTMARGMLSEDFPSIPMSVIMKQFYDSGMVIYTAYQSLADAERVWDPNNPSYHKLKQARKVKSFHPSTVDEKLTNPETPPDQKRAYAELKDVRAGRAKCEGKLAAKMKREADAAAAKEKYEADEAANLELAIIEGTMEECGCCFDDFPRNRMINCNNESISHYFCKRCARLHAETQIGSGKYELQCMSTDGCQADYSYAQRQLFLDANLTTALDRIAAETNLRLAGIENLASCPFCPYAAEYPPIEEERLFHCVLDSCKKISCRMCLKESHIPKTCQENAKDIGLDVRREVEEAMTAALVRLCNKCKGPFIKEDGCNKMNCPCGNIQCYVCSKSCQYNHFDDERRGGKAGNCPLFDDVQVRHEDETKRAETLIVEKLKKEHPEVDPEDLEIRVSDAVKEDEERRKKKRWNPHEPFRHLLVIKSDRRIERRMRRTWHNIMRMWRIWDLWGIGRGTRVSGSIQICKTLLPSPHAVLPTPPESPDKYKHVRFPRHHDSASPAHQALYEAARARGRADRQAQDEALAAAEGGNKELRDRLAAGRKEARRGLRELVRERIAAANEAANAAIAAEEPKRGEDGDAEVVYRPGDKVVARRGVQEWVFEPFGAPPVPAAGGEEAGNAGNDGEMPLDDLLTEAYAAIGRAPRAPAPVDNRGEAGNAGNDGLMLVGELIAQAYAAIGRVPRARPVYNRDDFQLFPRQQPFMLPQHPPRPGRQPQPQPQQQQQPPADFEEFMMEQPLMDGYVEPMVQKLVPLPMKAVMDPHAVMDFVAPHRRGRANRPAA
ncbi:hypothetical protein VE04_09743, partial [Pseudogymnoascus sp. 24MN13]